MVFGWGKKREPEPEIPQTKQIALSDVLGAASNILELRKSQTIEDVRFHRELAVPLLRELSNIGRALEEDDLNVDDIDKNIRVIVIRGKKQVIDIIKKDIADLPKVSTYEDAVSLHIILKQILKKVGDTLGRQTRVIHIFAKKYAGKLKEILAEISSINAEIQKILKNFEDSTSSFAEIKDLLGQISSTRQSNSDSERKIALLNEDVVACNNKIATCTESIKEIKSSARYTKLLKQKEMLDGFYLQKTQLKGRVVDQFTKISRPLSRYEYASSLDKEQKLLLSEMIQHPFDALTANNKDTISVILENVKKGIISGSISVKDKTKSTSHVTEVQEALDGMISEISRHLTRQAAVETAISELTPSELPGLEKELEKTTRNKEDSEAKIQSLDKEISANESAMPRIINNIESKLGRFSNTRYAITDKK